MSEQRVVTTFGLVVAALGIASSVSPTADAWLSWAMTWVLAVGVGGPVLWWLGREAIGEVLLAREFARARPAPAQQLEIPTEQVEVRSE